MASNTGLPSSRERANAASPYGCQRISAARFGLGEKWSRLICHHFNTGSDFLCEGTELLLRGRAGMAGWAQIQPVGDGAIRIAFGDAIDNETIARVWAVRAALDRAFGSSVLDIVAAFASILIRFDPGAVRLPTVMATARGVLEHATVLKDIEGRVIHVKVCFHEPYALDLVDIATQTRMRPEEVVREFCRPHYRVAFLGFTAGFPYLTGLSPALDLPRLRTPRVRVPAGSVAIAGGQCGVYPRTSPGGWRVLGRTSATIFDPDRNPPALFAPADRVHFHPVDSLDAAVAEAES